MDLEQFVAQSEGSWRSMRSGHSLAFQQFEEVLSEVKIESLELNNPEVVSLLETSAKVMGEPKAPFRMQWRAESDWEPDDPEAVAEGSCILVPVQTAPTTGLLLRSMGYAEAEQAIGEYSFLADGTFLLTTRYGQSIAEERIWFVSENVRCRSSVLKTSEGSGVLQTSFASEVRKLQAKENN